MIKHARVQELLNNIKERRVLVIGDVMVDEFIWGNAYRIAPEAPVPVVDIKRETRHLGGAANVAANILALGGIPLVIGVIGADRASEILNDEFKQLGLSTYGLVTDEFRPTTVKTRVIAHSQQVVRIDREERAPVNITIETQLVDRLLQMISEAEAVVISDYDKGVITPSLLIQILQQIKNMDLPVCVDPKLKNFTAYNPVSIITPNHHEAEAITHKSIESSESLLDIGNQIKKMLGDTNVLITRGEEGMSLFTTDGNVEHIPTVAREVFDVTGAGDTVIATIALGLAASATMLESSILANHAAGVVVGKIGTAVSTPQEILNSFVSLT